MRGSLHKSAFRPAFCNQYVMCFLVAPMLLSDFHGGTYYAEWVLISWNHVNTWCALWLLRAQCELAENSFRIHSARHREAQPPSLLPVLLFSIVFPSVPSPLTEVMASSNIQSILSPSVGVHGASQGVHRESIGIHWESLGVHRAFLRVHMESI